MIKVRFTLSFLHHKNKQSVMVGLFLCANKNPAIVAGVQRGSTDEVDKKFPIGKDIKRSANHEINPIGGKDERIS